MIDNNLKYKINTSTVLIISDSELLVENISKELNKSGLLVVAVSENNKTIHRQAGDNVIYIDSIDAIDINNLNVDYFIYFKRFTRKEYKDEKYFIKNLSNDVCIYKKISDKYKPKSVFLMHGIREKYFSKKYESKYFNILKIIKTSGSLILYGDLVSSNKNTRTLCSLHEKLLELTLERSVRVNKNTTYYPIVDSDLTQYILKLLFSLSRLGKSILITGRSLRLATLVDIVGNNKILINRKESQRCVLLHDEEIILQRQSKRVVKDIFAVLRNRHLDRKTFVINKHQNNLLFKISQLKGFVIDRLVLVGSSFQNAPKFNKKKLAVDLFLFLLLLPLFLIISSMGLLFFSKISFEKDYIEPSRFLANTSLKFSEANLIYSNGLKALPLVGEYFGLFIKPSILVKLQAQSAILCLNVFGSLNDVFKNTSLRNIYDIKILMRKITLDLESLYQILGFLESEIANSNEFGVSATTLMINDIDIPATRNKALLLKNLIEKLASTIENDSAKKYLFIFQNNSYLRPTGGRIEAVSFVDIVNRKISAIKVENVSEIDKKITSYKEPPTVLKKYFGIKIWYLKDMNWDPNFTNSANEMISLLEKGFNTSVAGVASLDKRFLYRLLKIIDEDNTDVYLDSFFSETIDLEDYPEIKEKFPLTFLLNDLSLENFKLDNRTNTKIIKEIYKGLENGNIQVFLEDTKTQETLSDLGWGGSFFKSGCAKPCFLDFVSIIESTKGGDSLKIDREAHLSVYLEEGLIKRKLNFYINNQGGDNYQAYLRLFANAQSGFSPVHIISAGEDKVADTEIRPANGLKESGVYFEVKPQQTLEIVFNWDSPSDHDFGKQGEYTIFWRKQAGVDGYPVEVSLFTPKNLNINSEQNFTLTETGEFRYNTSLDRDIKARVFW